MGDPFKITYSNFFPCLKTVPVISALFVMEIAGKNRTGKEETSHTKASEFVCGCCEVSYITI